MKTITPLRQKFIDHLTLRQLSERTVETYIHWVADLARFHKASPDALGRPEISAFVLHLIQERKLSDCSVTLAIKSLRAFYGLFLHQDVAVLFSGIRTPRRPLQLPRVFSPDEVERLLTVGTDGDPLARAFLMTVYGCGLRLSEATHVRIADIDSKRFQLRVSNPKGGRERLVPLSDNLVRELRAWYRVHRPAQWLFSQGPDQDPICKGTAQNIYYRARRRAQLPAKCGIHGLRHSFATHLIENGVEITLVQKFLGHAYLSTTANYLHVRQERMGQVKSPLGLIRTDLHPRR